MVYSVCDLPKSPWGFFSASLVIFLVCRLNLFSSAPLYSTIYIMEETLNRFQYILHELDKKLHPTAAH